MRINIGDGFELVGVESADELLLVPPCANASADHATCTDIDGSFTCACTAGFTGDGVVADDGRVKVTAARVEHPQIKDAFAYRFDGPDRSIVFSGDTRPSQNLVRLAKGADVLVHEVMDLKAIERLIAADRNAATLRRHLVESHTTAEEVGQVAAAAGVKTLVLNHFVPGGEPAIPDEAWRAAVRPHFPGELVIGRDLMEL